MLFRSFNTSQSGTASIKIVGANIGSTYPYFTGGHTYNNSLDLSVGANYGLQVNANSVIAGAVTWRGGRLHGGRVTGSFALAGTCYAVSGASFEGGIVKSGSANAYLEADNGTMHFKSSVGAITHVCVINASGKAIFYSENLLAESIKIGRASCRERV